MCLAAPNQQYQLTRPVKLVMSLAKGALEPLPTALHAKTILYFIKENVSLNVLRYYLKLKMERSVTNYAR